MALPEHDQTCRRDSEGPTVLWLCGIEPKVTGRGPHHKTTRSSGNISNTRSRALTEPENFRELSISRGFLDGSYHGFGMVEVA